MQIRLTRSTTDRMVAGVCGGLAAYLAIDPILVRLFFVLLTLTAGSGVLVYLILWLIIPEATDADATENAAQPAGFAHPQARFVTGLGLALLGMFMLLRNFSPVWLGWLSADLFWPLLLIMCGIVLIARRSQGAPL